MNFPLLAALTEQAGRPSSHAALVEGAAHSAAAHGATAGAIAQAIQVSWLWLIPLFPLLGAA